MLCSLNAMLSDSRTASGLLGTGISDEFPRSMAQLPLVTLAPCVPRMPVAEPDRLRLPVLSHSKLHPSICTCPEAMSLAPFLLAYVTENVEYTPPTTLAGTASASGLA